VEEEDAQANLSSKAMLSKKTAAATMAKVARIGAMPPVEGGAGENEPEQAAMSLGIWKMGEM
jgi:hypothetical protein